MRIAPVNVHQLVDIELETTADFKQLSIRGKQGHRTLASDYEALAEDLQERLANVPTRSGTRSRRLLSPNQDAALRARIVAGYLKTAAELQSKSGWLFMKAYAAFLKHFEIEVEAAKQGKPAKSMDITEV